MELPALLYLGGCLNIVNSKTSGSIGYSEGFGSYALLLVDNLGLLL